MDVIIQGIEIETSDLRELAKLSGASRIERITGQAFRLVGACQQDNIPMYCLDARLDFAFVEQSVKLASFSLAAVDMDSTLVGIESIDEIADMYGIKAQVAEITAKAMCGEVNFSEGLKRRVALLQGLDQSMLHRVYDERLKLNPGAEKMLKRMKTVGIRTMLISGGFTFFTDRLKERLGLDYAAANTLEIVDGKLTGRLVGEIVGAQGKAEALKRVRNELGLRRDQLIAIGDGANDLQMMAEAGVSIAYHAKPIVQKNATYAIDHVGLDGVINLFE
ncbi:MAG: phosphoserine phosphatase SerB [Proteobacteria bacterium]|nr:phosphoserine phosphatase SerB [Pseudomonadota bacterium]